MSTHRIPEKPRRKRLEVPVHKVVQEQRYEPDPKEKIHKTYSANFNSKRYRQKLIEEQTIETQSPEVQFSDADVPEHDRPEKLSKKQLKRDNARMLKENQQLMNKFDQLEDLSSKKIVKLRDKVNSLQNINAEILSENSYLKEQYQCLLNNYELLKHEYEASKICKSCEDLQQSLEVYAAENNLLRKGIAELTEDVNMLKTVVYRLNVQMERYQEKLRNSNINTNNLVKASSRTAAQSILQDQGNIVHSLSESHIGHVHTPLAWGKVNVHTLGPLLDAYQDTLSEKEEIIQDYEIELSNFTSKLKEVIKENELLHIRLTEDNECSSKLKIEVERLKKELKATKQHNDILIKKCSMKQDKIDEILKCYESKVEQQRRDYSVLHEQYYLTRSEISALKEKNKALTDAQDDFKNERHNYIPVSVHTASVNECKKWYEELKSQYEIEKKKMTDNLEAQNKIIEELHKKVASLTSEKDEATSRVKHFKEQLKKAEAKHLELEHSLNEAQLAKTACRKQLNKAMSFAKDLVAEQESLLKVLNERTKENKTVKKIGSEIAMRMDSLKSQLKTVQKDAWQELNTVEQKIEEQNSAMETMKQEYEQELEKLRSIIKQQEENNLMLKGQASIPLPHYLLFRDKNK